MYTGKININEAERDQSSPLDNIVKFNNKSKKKKVRIKNEILMMV